MYRHLKKKKIEVLWGLQKISLNNFSFPLIHFLPIKLPKLENGKILFFPFHSTLFQFVKGMDWKKKKKNLEYFIHPSIWKFSRKKCNDYAHSIPFPLKKVNYQFYPYLEKTQIKDEWYNSNTLYFFHFSSSFYKLLKHYRKYIIFHLFYRIIYFISLYCFKNSQTMFY